jgi:hypothetical protein
MSEQNTAPVFSEDFLALSKKVQALLTTDTTTGITTAPKDFYKQAIVHVSDLPLETRMQAKADDNTLLAVTGHAFGEVSKAALASNPNLERTELAVTFYDKDKVEATIFRNKTGVALGKPYSKPGALQMSYTMSGCNPKTGALKQVAAGLAADVAALAS